MDNGPEFTAAAFEEWCEGRGIAQPDQNAFCERFNRTYRDELLDAYLFASIEQVQPLTEEWLTDYNTERLTTALAVCRC